MAVNERQRQAENVQSYGIIGSTTAHTGTTEPNSNTNLNFTNKLQILERNEFHILLFKLIPGVNHQWRSSETISVVTVLKIS